jgi:hypothetical protein
MTMPTADSITRLYLYGQQSIPNLISDNLIRPIATPTNVVIAPAVDVNDYMVDDPGRFVNAASFEVVRKFFSELYLFLPTSPPGGYTKKSVV